MVRTFALLTLTLLLGAPGGSEAAEVPGKPFAALPNGTLVYKNVVSMRERRFSNIVRQQTDFSCGAAAMATLLNHGYGWTLEEQDVIRGMLSEADPELVRTQGFSMLDMKRFAERLGYRARGYRMDGALLERVRVPSIVLVEVRGYKHFVVLQRSANGWIYLADPVLGQQKIPLKDFLSGWNGIIFAVIGPGYDRQNALLSPPEPLTAKQRLNAFGPLKDAELMEYGFIQSDFF